MKLLNTIRKNIALAFMLSVVFISCEKFENSPYEVSIKYKNVNNKNFSRIIHNDNDTIIFAVIGDSQRFYNSTGKIIEKINGRSDIEFTIHTGDLIDFGTQREYNWIHELLSNLNKPYVAVAGVHDQIANGKEIYQEMYGNQNFSFIHKANKFIFVNTNGREFEFDQNVPDISWLDQQLSDTANYKNAIIVSHIPPINDDFNPNLTNDYVSVLAKWNKTLLSINGHNHDYSLGMPFLDGIYYLNSYSTSKEKVVVVKIWNNDFSVEII